MRVRAKAPSSGSSKRLGAIALATALLVLVVLGATAASALAPVVTTPSATDVQYSIAHLEGEVNPEDHETTYWFEYTTQATYEAEGNSFNNAAQTNHETLAENAGLTPVGADPSGLTPDTTYHLRLVAENESGTESAEAASIFTTKAVAKPTVSGLSASATEFSGLVNPNAPKATSELEGEPPTTEEADVNASFETQWSFTCSPACSFSGPSSGTVKAGNQAVAVTATPTNLLPNQTYDVTLHATNLGGEETETLVGAVTTETLAPTVETDVAEDVTPDHVVLRGFIKPHNLPTTYYFEYGPTASYGTSVPASQDGDAGSSNGTIDVFQRIDGLPAGATYHYRLVAHSSAGTVLGDDATFTTKTPEGPQDCTNEARRSEQHADLLPDCRAYEIVSPPDKHGADVMGDSQRTRAAVDGEAFSFSSLGGFADVAGTGTATEYLSRRTGQAGTTGWSAHAITPPQKQMTAISLSGGADSFYQGEFSADLSHGVFNAWSSVTDDPDTEKVLNLYVRDDLLTPGAGHYQLLTECPACTSPLQIPLDSFGLPDYNAAQPVFAGASADFSHILFESGYQLTADAPAGGPYLYEWHNGAITLAGILPDGKPVASAKAARSASAGRGHYTLRTMSNDGERFFFATPDGSLYMRTGNGTPDARTVQLNASERTSPDPGGTAPATFWTATPSGSHVFFTSGEALTDDAQPGTHLYAYDTTLPDSDPENLTLVSNGGVVGAIGASDDGHAVYFVAAGGQLASRGPTIGNTAFFEWRDGVITYIARMERPSADQSQNLPQGSWIFPPDLVRARVTPDGKHLLFVSHSGDGVTAYDQGHTCSTNSAFQKGPDGCAELYVYSEASGAISCASCNPTGAPAQGDSTNMVRRGNGGAGTAMHLNRSFSDDGRYVFFSTADALVPEDTNGKIDAYQYDTHTGEPHLLSTGTDPGDSYFLDASADGRDAFIVTRQRLLGWDTDGAYDAYDVRVDGGLPEPVPVPAACSGEACQGSSSAAPAAGSNGSASLHGPGNRKPKRKHHKHKRDVKHHKHKSHRHGIQHRRAGADRRVSR